MSVDLPTTVWRDPAREVEFSTGDASDIVDTLGNNLVDTLGNQVVDTGVDTDYMPDTVWSQDDDV